MAQTKYNSKYLGQQVDNAVSTVVNALGETESKADHTDDYKIVLAGSNTIFGSGQLLKTDDNGLIVNTSLTEDEVAYLGVDGKIPTELLPDSIVGSMEYRGTFNATTATGPLEGLEVGWYFICATAGSKNPDGTTGPADGYRIHDWAIYNGATDGWSKISNSSAINMVNGTGVNSVQQTQSDKDVEFENPNYTPSYTYEVGAFGKDSAMLNGNSMAKGELSTAIGRNTLAEGARSFASGTKTAATANNAHAEGLQTLASGVNGAHAEGNATVASGSASHAEGNNNIASGSASHAEGTSNAVYGDYGHVGGRGSVAYEEGAFAHGRGIYVNQAYQVAFGKYNEVDNNALFSVGNGTDNSHMSSAFKVMSDGSAKVGGMGLNPSDTTVATKKYADDINSALVASINTKANNSDVVHLAGEETVSGYKKFTGGISVSTIKAEGASNISFDKTIRPSSDDALEVGLSNRRVKNIYISRNISDGTNSVTVSEIVTKTELTSKSNATNLENGSGTGSIQEIQDVGSETEGYFNFTGKNAHATAVDSSLTGNVAYGGTGQYATSLGGKSQASGKRSTAEGTTTIAKGNYSHSEGSNTVALATSSHAEGIQTFTNGNGSHAEGNNTQALGAASHSEGYDTKASSDNAHAEGYQTQALGSASHAEGSYGQAKSVASHTEGVSNYIGAKSSGQPSGGGSVSPSQPGTTPSAGDGSHAEGRDNYVYGHTSHAEGAQNVVNTPYSHAEGLQNTANGSGSHAEGNETTASGDYSHSEGVGTTASGGRSHAEGNNTTASGYASHAEGNNTTASNDAAHVQGTGCTASGKYSFASGRNSQAQTEGAFIHAKNGISRGNYSAVFGVGTKNDNTTAIDGVFISGHYNKSLNGALLEVGRGTDDTHRNNALTVYNDGRVSLSTLYFANEGYAWQGSNPNITHNNNVDLIISSGYGASQIKLIDQDAGAAINGDGFLFKDGIRDGGAYETNYYAFAHETNTSTANNPHIIATREYIPTLIMYMQDIDTLQPITSETFSNTYVKADGTAFTSANDFWEYVGASDWSDLVFLNNTLKSSAYSVSFLGATNSGGYFLSHGPYSNIYVYPWTYLRQGSTIIFTNGEYPNRIMDYSVTDVDPIAYATSGTQLYKHTIVTDLMTIEIITNDKTVLTSITNIDSLFDNSIRASYVTGGRKFRIETILSGYIYYVSGVDITDESIGNLVSDTVTQY